MSDREQFMLRQASKFDDMVHRELGMATNEVLKAFSEGRLKDDEPCNPTDQKHRQRVLGADQSQQVQELREAIAELRIYCVEQLATAHREGWEQAKAEAIIRCEAQERNRSEMSAAFYVAAMEYKGARK